MNNSLLLIRSKGIYDSIKHQVRPDDGLLVSGEKIQSIGSFAELEKKHPDARRLDLSSKYLFPGLINTHVHFEFDGNEDPRVVFIGENEKMRFLRSVRNANVMLRSGVTTSRDAGSTWGILDMLEPAVNELYPLPRLQLAGPPLTVTGGHLHFLGLEVDTVDELIRSVRLHQKRGCGAIKIIVTGGQMTPGSGAERISFTQEQILAATKEAAHLGLPTFAHCLTTEGFVNSVNGGVDCIEHVACFKRNHQNQLLERVYEPEVMDRFRGVNRYFTNALASLYHNLDSYRSGEKAPTPRETFLLAQEERMMQIFCKCVDLGLIPVLGTDAGVAHTPFDETFLELELLVERCGLPPSEAIKIGTINSAACLGLGSVTGQLTEGFSADIIALSQNPLENIHAFRNVENVICRGVPVVG